jgi:hypothetical protein
MGGTPHCLYTFPFLYSVRGGDMPDPYRFPVYRIDEDEEEEPDEDDDFDEDWEDEDEE